MIRTPSFHLPPFDAAKINETIERALASAGLDTTAGPMASVTRTIRQALSPNGAPGPRQASAAPDTVIDVAARVIDATAGFHEKPGQRPGVVDEADALGSFQAHEFSNAVGNRAYKLYVPTRVDANPPLVVMLHGCTQSADDFAAGTRMNRLAQEHGLLVVYPEQAAQANMSGCWNWFNAQDQVRDAGEPALIAGIVREVAARHNVDPRRIFVAGLSAGAAMAVVLGQAYPELFAGVGAHSGLPYASAHDIPSAMAAMKGGRGRSGAGLPRSGAASSRAVQHAVPTIVFHGDRDHTVQHDNAVRIVEQVSAAFRQERSGTALTSSTLRATSPAGRSYSRTVHADADGVSRIESWTLHGAGHAWSGGHASGSYTDGSGPDASAEMVRFFMAIARAGSA